MATFSLVITDAGRQAIVDATNTGTLPVVLSQVALGTGGWSPDATATALQSEIKRIDTVGGQAVAADTIHVTVTDDSADTYALAEFGLYTDGGVLFAIYSDPTGITDKAVDALLLLAADIVLTSVPPGSVTVNGTGFANPQATETLAGVAKVATQPETNAGTDDEHVVTPKKLMGAATSAATANMLIRRDSAGRAKVVSPAAPDDIARKDNVDAAAPPGMVAHFARSTPPAGWLEANGAAVSRTTYAALFSAIGIMFGAGDGSTTFNLPDLRGEFIRGYDAGRGADPGRNFGSAQSWAIENIYSSFTSRSYHYSGQQFPMSVEGAFYYTREGGSSDSISQGSTDRTYTKMHFDASRVVNAAAETRPRNLALLACIKY